MKLVFASIFLLIFALMLFFAKKRFFNKINFSKNINLTIFGFLIFIYFGVILYFLNRFYDFLSPIFYYISSLCIAFGFVIFVFAIFYEFYKLLCKILNPNEKINQIIEFSIFYLMLGYLFVAVASCFLDIKINEYNIKTTKIAKNTKIVFLSDLHIGPLVDEKYVRNVVRLVNTENPDVVILGGDILDDNIQNSTKALEELSGLKAKNAIFYALGNHEYFYGEKQSLDTFQSLGFLTLENNTFVLEKLGINISGIYDFMGLRKGELSPNLNGFKKSENFNILISHQPKVISEPNFNQDMFDLVLSGHTHCGQIFPFGLLVLLQQPYLCKDHKIGKNSQIIISSGVGFWGPKVRIGSDFEILVVNLEKSSEKQ